MSEALLKIFLSELKTIRIMCRNKNCGAIIEGDVARIHILLSGGGCKYCNQTFRQGSESPLTQLTQAMSILNDMQEQLGVEFIIPVKNEKE